MRASAVSPVRALRLAVGSTVAILLATLAPLATAAPGDLRLALRKDFNPGPADGMPQGLTVAGTNLFYTACDPTFGCELWRATANGGSSLLKDLTPGSSGSNPTEITAVGSRVFFSGMDANQSHELYMSNGTQAGTRLVRDIADAATYLSSYPTFLTGVGDVVYFSAQDNVGDRELWRSDGTYAGTRRVRNIAVGINDSDPTALTVMGGELYFSAHDHTGASYLWTTDGTPAGTVKVTARRFYGELRHMIAVGNVLYFQANDNNATNGAELWRSDGTAAGTRMVRNIVTTAGVGSEPRFLTASGGWVYFSAADGSGDRELWRSDGTTAGTRRVKNVNPDAGVSSHPMQLTDVGGRLYFTAIHDFHIRLWTSDGTAAGTVQLPATYAEGSDSPDQLAAWGDHLVYRSRVGVEDDQLWITDGTAAGTRGIGPVSWSGFGPDHLGNNSPGDMVEFNGALWWRDHQAATGQELWRGTMED